MSFEPLRRILPKAIQNAGITRQVEAVRVLEEFSSALVRLWGDERAASVRPISFKDGVLKITSDIPVAIQELKVWRIRIQNEMNRVIGSKAVREIQIADG